MPVLSLPRVADSVLVVVDIQEKLAAAMPPQYLQGNITRAAKLTKGARRLGIPVLVTEQYPKGLGPTLPVIRSELGDNPSIVAKNEFDCTDCPGVADLLTQINRRQVVLIGMEAHVCVLQSAIGLVSAGFRPTVVVDAVLSRYSTDFHAGIGFLRAAGVPVLSFESVLFGWMRKAGTPEFKELSHLAREKDL